MANTITDINVLISNCRSIIQDLRRARDADTGLKPHPLKTVARMEYLKSALDKSDSLSSDIETEIQGLLP